MDTSSNSMQTIVNFSVNIIATLDSLLWYRSTLKKKKLEKIVYCVFPAFSINGQVNREQTVKTSKPKTKGNRYYCISYNEAV